MNKPLSQNDQPIMPIENAIHLCVDMQRIFAKGGIWETPWMERVTAMPHEWSSPASSRPIRPTVAAISPALEDRHATGTGGIAACFASSDVGHDALVRCTERGSTSIDLVEAERLRDIWADA